MPLTSRTRIAHERGQPDADVHGPGEKTDRGMRVVSPTGGEEPHADGRGVRRLRGRHRAAWPTVAFALRGREEGIRPEVNGDGQRVSTLRAASGRSSKDYLAGEWGVRRLTPRECERRQASRTTTPQSAGTTRRRKVLTQSDSARGHRLGNAVAVPVIEWVARGSWTTWRRPRRGLSYDPGLYPGLRFLGWVLGLVVVVLFLAVGEKSPLAG